MMKKSHLLGAVFIFLTGISQSAHSSTIDFVFDIELSNWLDISGGLMAGDTLEISFLEGTDLYDISVTDIYSFKYNVSVGVTGTSYVGGSGTNITGDIGEQFSYDGTALTIAFLDGSPANSLYAVDDLGYESGITTQGIFAQSIYAGYGYHYGDVQHTGVAWFPVGPGLTGFEVAAVPIPAAAWLFGSGLLSLIGMARRKKA